MFPDFAIDADRPINERIEEMDTKANTAARLGDIKISPTQKNEGLVIRQTTGHHTPEITLAAFTTPAEMIAWLAEQYGVEPLAPASLTFVPSGDVHKMAWRARDAATRPSYGKHTAIKALEEAAPRYQWKTREDFVAALTMALTVRGYSASMAPGQHARGIADIIDNVHAQGIGE